MEYELWHMIVAGLIFVILLPLLLELNSRVFDKHGMYHDPYWGYEDIIKWIKRKIKKHPN